MQIPFAMGAVLMKNSIFNEVRAPFLLCKRNCAEDNSECHKHNEEMKKQNCTNSYFDELDEDSFAWGMMFKQLQEQVLLAIIGMYF